MMNTQRRLVSAVLLAVLLGAGNGCGGNYSNEDIEFQLALPDRDDLLVRLPGQALVVGDAAEYYVATRDVVTRVNAIVLAITGLVDRVRAFPPSERQGPLRVWGPFPHEKDPAFQVRMTMVRVPEAEALRFDYRFEFKRVADAAPEWQPLIAGSFLPGGGARLNKIVVDLKAARLQNYPIADFGELEEMQIEFQRRVAPYRAIMVVRNIAAAATPGATYAYAENADGSGDMRFAWQVRVNIWVAAIELFTRWLPSGAGRADARILEGLAAIAGSRGVDCWGPDARATYVRRDWGEAREVGDPASCVLPAPAP